MAAPDVHLTLKESPKAVAVQGDALLPPKFHSQGRFRVHCVTETPGTVRRPADLTPQSMRFRRPEAENGDSHVGFSTSISIQIPSCFPGFGDSVVFAICSKPARANRGQSDTQGLAGP